MSKHCAGLQLAFYMHTKKNKQTVIVYAYVACMLLGALISTKLNCPKKCFTSNEIFSKIADIKSICAKIRKNGILKVILENKA